MSKVTITKSSIIADTNKGLTRKEMMAKYNVSQKQLNAILVQAGVGDYKANVKTIEFVDDVTTGEIVDVSVTTPAELVS